MKRDPILWALGRELWRLRKARGLRQWQLAELSGLHPNYISGIERAERNIGMATIFRLARGLSIHPAELMETFP